MYKVRKSFFTCLMMAVVILSVIASTKLTVIFNIPIACSFFIFPLAYLSIVVINDLKGAKDALITLINGVGILIISYLLIALVLNLPNQIDTINEANAIQLLYGQEINGIYLPNIKIMIGSIIGLLAAGLSLIGIYSSASKYTFKTISCFLAVLIAQLLFNAIYIFATEYGVTEGNAFIMLILNRFIFSVAWTFLISILFLIFSHHKKEKSKVTIEEVTKKEANIEEKPKTVSKPKKSTKNIEIRNNQKSVKNTNSKNKEKKK